MNQAHTHRRGVLSLLIALFLVLLACKGEEKDATLGQQVKLEDSVWEVVSAKLIGNNIQGLTGNKTTAGKFVKVEYKVTNMSKKDETILDHPKVIDDQQREFAPMDDQSLFMSDPEKSITLESLPPSMMKRFFAIYELPADAKGLRFETRALSAFGEKKKVALGM